MFDIAWSEFMLVAVVALVVVGPRDLPALLRTVGKTVAMLRKMAGEFQTQFNDAMREAELDELRKEVTGLKDKASALVSAPNPLQIARDEIRNALESKPSALAGSPPAAEAAAQEPAPSALAPRLDPLDEPPPPPASDFAPAVDRPEPDGAAHPSTPAPAEPAAAPDDKSRAAS